MPPGLRRALGFRDLVLFYLVTTFSLRWIATAAVAGPSAIVLWIIGGACLFVPLVFTVLELSSRYPDEGGLYVWSKRAFGPFAGFITGWTYWTTNLPYLPSLLYFIAANALFMGGADAQKLSTNSAYFIAVSIAGLAVSVWLNVIGLDVGKWLSNVGAVAGWLALGILIPFGVYSWITFGSATPLPLRSFLPGAGLKELIFLSTIAFAYAGVENASTMGEEIVDARRTVPRAVVVAAIVITVLYIVGTMSILLALPPTQVSGLQGLVQAMQAIAARAGVPWIVPVVAGLVVVNVLGGVAGWFAATARLPFVAGVDRYLPEVFGRLHPRWQTPYVALLVQAVFAACFIVLGQAGTTVRGAYDALISLSVIAQFIPYLFMFASMIVLQREPAGPEVIRTPGGAPVAMLLGALGFVVSVATIVLACVPAADDPNKTLAVIKIVGGSVALIAAGALVYYLGKRRS
jgi:amino acid transporter